MMMNMMLLADVPPTPSWSPTISLVMILCNVGVIVLWKSVLSLINSWLGAIGYDNRTSMVVPEGNEIFTFNLPGFSLTLPELVAAASFGHLIGAGVILGLTRLGAL